jgi:hypothetical protein
MTELRGSSATWRTAAVAAPAAAAAFALVTGWALEHPPQSAGTSAVAAPAAQAVVAPDVDIRNARIEIALDRRAEAAQARVAHLTRALARLRASTEQARHAPLRRRGSRSAVVRSSGGGGSAAVPAPPAARAAARAPVAHTTTGAS